MKIFIALVIFVVGSHAVNFEEAIVEQWKSFKALHKREYNQVEDLLRQKIFIDNIHKIAVHNQKYARGLVQYKLKINEFADLLSHEFRTALYGFNRTVNLLGHKQHIDSEYDGSTFIPPAHVHLPTSVDWRTKGAVTPVKNQGRCGSCWSFSATGALEGQHYRKTGKLISLSEQNLMDCTAKYGNLGCDGGFMDNAFRYIIDNHGIDTEESYPYHARIEPCKYNPKRMGATVHGFSDIPANDEDSLKAAVATVGPISVGMDASPLSFQFYSSGIYSEPTCSTTNLDHAVLLVGYGTDERGNDYWIAKNSWGTSWGDDGYFKISRNRGNVCGIATAASFPVV